MTPLCPHCYREACPWLVAREHAQLYHRGASQRSTRPELCPFHDKPLPPLVRQRLCAALERETDGEA